MTNHFHLVIRTPKGNLVYGMKWLQSTLETKEFKKEVLKSEGLLKDGDRQAVMLEGAELQEANELQWESLLERGLNAAGKSNRDIQNDRKSADWKVWIAYHLKHRSSASNPWITSKLNMGAAQAVSLHTSRLEPGKLKRDKTRDTA